MLKEEKERHSTYISHNKSGAEDFHCNANHILFASKHGREQWDLKLVISTPVVINFLYPDST